MKSFSVAIRHECIVIVLFSDGVLQNSYSPVFEPFYLPAGSDTADIVYTITVKIIDVFWSTTVVVLRARIGAGLILSSQLSKSIYLL